MTARYFTIGLSPRNSPFGMLNPDVKGKGKKNTILLVMKTPSELFQCTPPKIQWFASLRRELFQALISVSWAWRDEAVSFPTRPKRQGSH